MLKAVVVDRDYGSVSLEELTVVQDAYKEAGIDLQLCQFNSEEEIVIGCQDAVAILATGNPPISRAVMKALPGLRYIQRFGAGVDSIDLAAAGEMEIIVINLPGFCANELADLATAMIMGLIRNMVYYDRKIRNGSWPKCQYLLPGDIREMTLGLFGFGAAGRALYETFHRGFGTKVISCDPYVSEEMRRQYSDVEFVSFEELLERSDILSIHAALTQETFHIFNEETFTKMKENALIINTARGGLIDQTALYKALETQQIRGAGLDTLEKEPIAPNDPLLLLDNVILNPHSGSYGAGAKKLQIEMVSQLIPEAIQRGALSGKFVANRANISGCAHCQIV